MTNLGNGDADALDPVGTSLDKQAFGLNKNAEALAANSEENTNLLSGLLANIGSITGFQDIKKGNDDTTDG